MSKTYTRKIHQGEIKKRENEIERAKQEELLKEQQEAESWKIGAKVTAKEIRAQKEKEKADHKKALQELYEKEMNPL